MLEIHCPHCQTPLKVDPSKIAEYKDRSLRCADCKQLFQYNPSFLETNTVELPAFLKATINMVADGDPTVDADYGGINTALPALDKRYRYSLEVISGMDKGRRYPIEKARIDLGRHLDMDVQLSDVGISRKHATLEIMGDCVMLTDHNSHNGSFVGQERIKTAPLQKDMEFTLAVTSLQLHLEGPLEKRIGISGEG